MKIIGEFQEMYNNKYGELLPKFKSMVTVYNDDEKQFILNYLKSGTVISAAAGTAKDVLTNEKIPGEWLLLTDGVFSWGTDTIYYFEKYNIDLGRDFLDYLKNKLAMH